MLFVCFGVKVAPCSAERCNALCAQVVAQVRFGYGVFSYTFAGFSWFAGGNAEERHDIWKVQMAKAAVTSRSKFAAAAEPDADVKDAIDWISRHTPAQAWRAPHASGNCFTGVAFLCR